METHCITPQEKAILYFNTYIVLEPMTNRDNIICRCHSKQLLCSTPISHSHIQQLHSSQQHNHTNCSSNHLGGSRPSLDPLLASGGSQCDQMQVEGKTIFQRVRLQCSYVSLKDNYVLAWIMLKAHGCQHFTSILMSLALTCLVYTFYFRKVCMRMYNNVQ